MQLRAQRALAQPHIGPQVSFSVGSWTPLGPAPLASDASGNGTQDYHQVAGRATAVVIDPADPSGNTVYVGGAQSGIWKSTNAANSVANNVAWTPITDNQATLSIGAIAIQPGNSDLNKTLILGATGEANNSGDSYFGLGILRSADGGNTWSLISTANNGGLSFSGLGGTRMAFSAASGQTSTAVAAMAASSEGIVDGAVTSATKRGLYTSLDAGLSWTYDALIDPAGPTDATSATSVVYNDGAGRFFAAIRYHGFYSSPDGVTWTRLTNQPGGALLSTAACPSQAVSNNYGCPIYRGEIATVPGRNEMYVWYVYFSALGDLEDGGIWKSLDGGASWTSISNSGITNCGDGYGCGVQQGTYNLELLAMPNGGATDLYAGAINLYKCQISSINPSCAASPFINLTHAYGCSPIAAPSHVHPDQHALAGMIPASGSDSGKSLLFVANDGGIYRALDGYSVLTTGSCSGVNQFDDLNQNLGSMAQFVSFSQDPNDPNTIFGGTQDNGSPATNHATTSQSWVNVLGGDGGYNAIDPIASANFYASNPDVPPQGLGIQLCTSGIYCNNSAFNFVVTSSGLDGDDGAFYFPYILDPGSSTALLVGTCRVWRGPRAGGLFTALSPNFDTLGSATCSGNEVNQVRGLAAAGTIDSDGSGTIYATTNGLGPLEGPAHSPTGGRVWETTNATAGPATFLDVTDNGPQGNVNPNQYPISGVAIDPSDVSGKTAYVTVMGFTGGTGHVWKTTNAGASWSDFTANLPDSPANAVLVYAPMAQVFVATDVGVFASPTSAANWTELGPAPSTTQAGFLPNVAVTALAVFNHGGQQLLRASTYGRGMWQFNLLTPPDFQLLISNSPQTISAGQTATFNGSATALSGYTSSVALSCASGITPPPATCTPSPSSLTPGAKTPFVVSTSGAAGDYYFNVQGVGSDSNHATHRVSAVLHIVSNATDFALSGPASPPTVNAGGNTMVSSLVSVTATSGFQGVIALTCSVYLANGNPANASCTTNPSTVTSIPSQVSVTVNATNLGANQNENNGYQISVQGTSGSITHTVVIPFNVGDYQLSGQQSLTVGMGGQGTDSVTVTASAYYSGRINATCDIGSKIPGASCVLNPSPLILSPGAISTLGVTMNVPSNAAPGSYSIDVNTTDATGTPSHSISISLTVAQNFSITASQTSQTVNPGGTTQPYNLIVAPIQGSFTDPVAFSCTGLAPGAQCVFNPSTVTPGNGSATVAMTISTATSTTAGTYAVTIVAASGSLSHSVPVSLVVTKDFQLAAQGFPADVTNGATVVALVTLTSNYNGSVNANCDSTAVAGSQCTIGPTNPVLVTADVPAQLAVTLKVPNNASAGTHTINLVVTDSSGQPSHAQHLSLTITDFSISSLTASQTVNPGQTTGAYQLAIAPNPTGSSFSFGVTLSCTAGLPTGAQCAFNPAAPITPGNVSADVVMNISTSDATSAGTYPITVTGTSGPLSHSSSVSLIVGSNPANGSDFTLTTTQNFPATATGGSTLTAKVMLTPIYNYGGTATASCDDSAIAGAQCVITPANPIAISANSPVILTLTLNLPNNAMPNDPSNPYNVNLTVADSTGQPSHTLQPPLVVNIVPDFLVSSATSSQTVNAGQTSGPYALSVKPVGSSFTGSVSLACTAGLPAGAQCIFNPSTPVTPGNSAVDVVMNISTRASSAGSHKTGSGNVPPAAIWLPLAAVVFGMSSVGRQRRALRVIVCMILCLLTMLFASCAGVSNGGGGGGQPPPPVTYHITVTGASAGTPPDAGQSTTVTLVVN